MTIRLNIFRFLLTVVVTLTVSCDQQELTARQKQARIQEMMTEYRAEFPDVPRLDTQEVVDLQKAGAVLVDARTSEEQSVSRIPGSISLADFDQSIANLKERKVIVYCTIGYRSGKCAAELRQEGIDAYNYEGSILSWTHAGLPLETPARETTRRVHVYGKKWALQAEGYDAVW